LHGASKRGRKGGVQASSNRAEVARSRSGPFGQQTILACNQRNEHRGNDAIRPRHSIVPSSEFERSKGIERRRRQFKLHGGAANGARLLYNRAFFRGLRVSELLQQDPNKRDKFRSRPAQLRKPGVQPLSSTHANGNGKGHQAGFTPVAMTRENSMDDLRAAGMRPRTGLQAQVGEHSYLNRSKLQRQDRTPREMQGRHARRRT
jgi:hypothetical protein